MSRLAAVRTGQPTQGLGAVPVAKVPSKAVLDQLEAANHNGSSPDGNQGHGEPSSAPAFPPADSLLTPRNHYSAARAAATAAWLSLEAKEIEVRQHFRTVPVLHGLEILAKMRKQCDLAAETLQQRMDEGNTERCTGCGKTLEEARKSQWIMQGSEVDSETGVPIPYRYCGPQCVRERNREKMLPPDQRNKLRADGREMGDVL